MYGLQKHNIYPRELSLDKNFIKDVYHDAGSIGHWKYVIDGLEYFIPNHGNIVMFDSSYSDKLEAFKLKRTVDKEEFKLIKRMKTIR